MARKRIKKILPKTTIGETIESFGPGGGVGGRTRVTKASGPKLEKEFMSNVKSGKTPAPSKGLVKVETSPTKSPNRTKPLGYKSNPNDGIPF